MKIPRYFFYVAAIFFAAVLGCLFLYSPNSGAMQKNLAFKIDEYENRLALLTANYEEKLRTANSNYDDILAENNVYKLLLEEISAESEKNIELIKTDRAMEIKNYSEKLAELNEKANQLEKFRLKYVELYNNSKNLFEPQLPDIENSPAIDQTSLNIPPESEDSLYGVFSDLEKKFISLSNAYANTDFELMSLKLSEYSLQK